MKSALKKDSKTLWYNLVSPGALMEMQQEAEFRAALGWDVYFSTCPARQSKSERERTEQTDVCAVPALFVDVDTQEDPAKAGKRVPLNVETAIGGLAALPVPPSLLVRSGRGVHAYWLLEEPLYVDGPERLEDAKATLKGFARSVAAVTGWADLDTKASEPARVLRVPGTQNHKSHPSAPVVAIGGCEARYSLDTLRVFIAANPSNEPSKPAALPVEAVGCSSLTDEEIIQRLQQNHRTAALWAGNWQAFPQYPSQSEADQALCNDLVFWGGRDAERVDRLFRQSGLYRPKWEREGYRGDTITKAISGTPTVYTGAHPASTAAEDFGGCSVRPRDFTDVGNAQMFAQVFKGKIIYVKSVGFLVWGGTQWVDNDYYALGSALWMTDRMLQEANAEIKAAGDALTAANVARNEDAEREASTAMKRAEAYRNHALKTRNSARIMGLLNLAQPLLQVQPEALDAFPYLLNTPAGMIDLHTGALLPHNPLCYCTKITQCSPGADGLELWRGFLNTITTGNEELAGFLQALAGMSALGKVYEENLVIALGDGRNGKSALFNALAAVLGGYAGTLAAEVLTTANRSKGAEMATLKGKRLIIAAETEEGARLSSSMVKQLTSTDKIHAERKFKDPEDFTPSHTLVLYTNHLPRVGSTDSGTWRRLVVVPFNAKITATQEVKNYADKLMREAGGAILTWIIEGAKRFVEAEYKLTIPDDVKTAIEEYKQENDWLGAFLSECCTTGPGKQAAAGALYQGYRNWAESAGERYIRSRSDFNAEMEKRGLEQHRITAGVMWLGIAYPISVLSM